MDNMNDTPALETIVPEPSAIEPGFVELEMHRHASLLAQIEVASCFRGQPEPLFREISPIIYSFQYFSVKQND